MKRNNASINLLQLNHQKNTSSNMTSPEGMFDLEEENTKVSQQRTRTCPQSESGNSSWGSDASYQECLGSAEDGALTWAIGDLENASAMAWSTLQKRGCASLQNLAHLMANTLGRAVVRTGLGAGSATESMTQLRHSFLVCRHPQASVDLYVDPLFRDQFVLSRSDEEYNSFLATVPQMFVGTQPMLSASVRVCGGCMGEALDRAGMDTPPWREPAALLSKWTPLHWRDELYLGLMGSPGAGGPAPGPAVAQAVVAAMRPGSAPTPARVTVHSYKHGSKVVEVVPGTQPHARLGAAGGARGMAGIGAVGPSAAAKVPRVPVVRVADAPPRSQVFGFQAGGGAVSATTIDASVARTNTPAMTAARTGPHPVQPCRPEQSPVSSAMGSLAVSSLSDEFVVAQRAQRKGACMGSSKQPLTTRSNLPLPLPGAQAAPGASSTNALGLSRPPSTRAASTAASNASSCASQNMAVATAAAMALAGRHPVTHWRQFKPLDQLLPQIRTVKLGGA